MSSDPTPSSPAPDPVEITLRLREGARVRITLDLLDEAGHPLQTGSVIVYAPTGKDAHEETIVFRENTPSPQRLSAEPASLPENEGSLSPTEPQDGELKSVMVRARQAIRERKWTLPEILFGLGLLIYLLVRFIGLPDYPIYFFSDEAIPTVLAADLLSNNFVYEDNTFFPTYFRNGRKFSLSATVYLNMIPYMLLGKSVWVARGTTVLITLLGAAGIGLILKQIFDRPYWWAGPLILSVVPSWFLHSRTAFETAVACSFFAAFLYFYLLYRTRPVPRAPRYLPLALFFGAFTFYSYAPAQLVILTTGIGLLISDFRYHWEHRKANLGSVGLLGLFALPYLRFHLTHPGAFAQNLQESSSYWIGDYTTSEKIGLFLKQYFTGLSPLYWYFPNQIDIPRHIMNGYGNILWITLPFALIGVYHALRNLRTPAWRVLLIALAASPVGAAVSGLGVTRALFFVIPATLLTGLGLDAMLGWIQTRVQANWFSSRNLTFGLFGLLALGSVVQMGDALLNGPFWNTDYSMNGMQYGARQVFGEIKNVLERSTDTKIKLSPDWANGVQELARFFLNDPLPLEFDSLQSYTVDHREIDPKSLFVVSFSEYLRVANSNKLNLQVEKSILDPNGHPAFLFVHAEYVVNIDEILAAEAEARHQLLDGSAYFEGVPIPVRYPKLDMGDIPNIFDNNDDTLIRTAEANPLVIEMYLHQVHQVSGLELKIGATLARITVRLSPEFGAEPVVFSQELEGFLNAPTVIIDFGQTVPASVIRIEIQDVRQSEPGHIHLWEVRLR